MQELTNKTVIYLTVGDYSEHSVFNINGLTYDAQPGQDYSGGTGGDGYSGGGSWCGYDQPTCHGGSDGGDGVSGPDYGGNGTHEDISSYAFDNFELTPGKGGLSDHGDSNDFVGGGGGGVLVNHYGPNQDSDCQGEGYGGGGCYPNSNGLRGVIIIEIAEII